MKGELTKWEVFRIQDSGSRIQNFFILDPGFWILNPSTKSAYRNL